MFRVICIDDTGKPPSIKPENWIKKDRIYTVIEIYEAMIDGTVGYILEEVKPKVFGIAGYRASRFREIEEMSDEALAELMEECLTGVNI
jgi:hypothetical protein